MALKKIHYVCESCGYVQYFADFDICPACGYSHNSKTKTWAKNLRWKSKKGNVILEFALVMLFAIIVFLLALPPEVREAMLNG